jgi:predicted Zn-ribbon and HTH transcriptional regulator
LTHIDGRSVCKMPPSKTRNRNIKWLDLEETIKKMVSEGKMRYQIAAELNLPLTTLSHGMHKLGIRKLQIYVRNGATQPKYKIGDAVLHAIEIRRATEEETPVKPRNCNDCGKQFQPKTRYLFFCDVCKRKEAWR